MESPEAEDFHFKVENDMQLKHGLFSSEEYNHSRSHEDKEDILSNGNQTFRTFKDDQFWFNPGLLKVNWTKVITINSNKSMTTEQMESLISRSGNICFGLTQMLSQLGRSAIDRALASHHEGRGSNLVGANKCPCTSSLNYMP